MSKIIVYDIWGIQGYIFDIPKNKSATKRLKGRSFFIEILLRKIVNDLKTKFDADCVLQSGWKAILKIKNFNENLFKQYHESLEKQIYQQFYGQLKVFFGVWNYNESDFKTSLQEAFFDLEKNKKQAFNWIFQKNNKRDNASFVFEWDRWPNNICWFTRWDKIYYKKWDKELDMSWIKKILDEENLEWISLNAYNDIIISNFLADISQENKIKLFENNDERGILQNEDKKYIPKINTQIKTFEDIAWENGFNKLACLKWDIDDLWNIFTNWLQEENYEKNYKELSKILDDFWNHTLFELIKDKNIYIVYAWWDDFLAIGRWNEIIRFYNLLKEKFNDKINKNQNLRKILNNSISNITFSWAINLFWIHDTFFSVVKQTDILLKEAKDIDGKNQTNIFWQNISNNDFDKLLIESKLFKEKFLIEDESWRSAISISTLRFLLWIARKIILEDKNNKENLLSYTMWRAELFYHLSRNYKTKDWSNIKDIFRKYIDGMLLENESQDFQSLAGNDDLFNKQNLKDIWAKLVVMMTYLLYQERDKKTENK